MFLHKHELYSTFSLEKEYLIFHDLEYSSIILTSKQKTVSIKSGISSFQCLQIGNWKYQIDNLLFECVITLKSTKLHFHGKN